MGASLVYIFLGLLCCCLLSARCTYMSVNYVRIGLLLLLLFFFILCVVFRLPLKLFFRDYHYFHPIAAQRYTFWCPATQIGRNMLQSQALWRILGHLMVQDIWSKEVLEAISTPYVYETAAQRVSKHATNFWRVLTQTQKRVGSVSHRVSRRGWHEATEAEKSGQLGLTPESREENWDVSGKIL